MVRLDPPAPHRGFHSFLVASCSALFASVCLLAPAPGSAAWQTFGKSVGFPEVWIDRIYEDRSETLWFGRIDGVSSYDGVRWVHYTSADGIREGVRGFADAPGGGIWAATFSGLMHLQDGRWSPVPGGPPAGLTCALATRSGDVWIGVNAPGPFEGVMRFDGSMWTRFTASDGLASNLVNAVLEDLAGNLWFACGPSSGAPGGLSRYNGTTFQTYTTAGGLPSNDVLDVGEDAVGNLWALTAGGTARFNGATFMAVPGGGGDFLLVEQNGNVWTGSRLGGGPARFDGVAWRAFRQSDGLFYDEDCNDLYQDRAGNVWVANRYGLARFDGAEWKVFTEADGLPYRDITSFFLDRTGGFWIGTLGAGAARFDGATWRSYAAVDGLTVTGVYAMLQDRTGEIWFAGSGGVNRFDGASFEDLTSGLPPIGRPLGLAEDAAGRIWLGGESGASRFDGLGWTDFSDSLASLYVNDIHVDRMERVWFATGGGLTRYDSAGWRTFREADGLGYDRVTSIAEDSLGNLWFATPAAFDHPGGATRYDGTSWTIFSTAEGVQSGAVTTLFVDHRGVLWAGSNTIGLPGPQRGGASRYDGERWRNWATEDGLPIGWVRAIGEDAQHNIWFATPTFGSSTADGPVRLSPDFVPPQTVFLLGPPGVSPVGAVSVAAVAAFGEAQGVEFAFRIDGSPWTRWSPIGSWELASDLPDGAHVIEARCRDREGNVDSTAAAITFEVDATPPAPSVASPRTGDIVRGIIGMIGSTADARFDTSTVIVRPLEGPPLGTPSGVVMAPGPKTDSEIATWDTRLVPDGVYSVDVVVRDSLGLSGITSVRVTVDNQFPPAEVSSPAIVQASTGGDVFTDEGDFHLYFAPRSLPGDSRVTVARLSRDSIPDPLPTTGARRAGVAYDVFWEPTTLVMSKPARAEQSLEGKTLPAGTPAFYYSADGSTWRRLGGTLDQGALRIPVSAPGRYALFTDGGGGEAPGVLSGLAFTPRVFSPTGAFADREVGIGFSLPRAAPTTIRVFNRSGRLIREVARGQALSAGANMVRWDGRDESGRDVLDGIYVVTVEALGTILKETLAVVR